MNSIYIISDGTGKTAEQMLNAALTQFTEDRVTIHTRPGVTCKDEVLAVFKEASQTNAFIAHTVVSDELRSIIEENKKLFNIETIDLMGPLLAQLTVLLDINPVGKPGLFRELNKSYFKRIEAMEFAFRHDDGLRINQVERAEIVLLGVSRTFKTPLSIYLAFKGWMVSNIPIVLDIPLPQEIFDIPNDRVFGLTTDATRLSVLRKARDDYLGGKTGSYAQLQHVQNELRYANRLYSHHPNWQIINVTNKPIEEIASEIITCLRNKAITPEGMPDEGT